jgi:hypothetical protein
VGTRLSVVSSRDPDVVLGPLAVIGLLSLGWAARRRSRLALGIGFVALVLETRSAAYRRFKHDRRFQALNLVTVYLDRRGAAGRIELV